MNRILGLAMTLTSSLFTGPGPGKKLLEDCAINNADHIFKGKPNRPGLDDAVTRIQRALSQLGFSPNDPPGVFGQGTADAVLKFKNGSHPILGPGQKTPDNIVGIQTIHRLDADIQFKRPVLEFGSTSWKFSFFGNTGLVGKDVFSLSIGSTETQDGQNFNIFPTFINKGSTFGFKGEASGTFRTPRKALVKEFRSASCQIFLGKQFALLNGTINLGTIGDPSRQLIVILNISNLRDESFGGDVTIGFFRLSGQLRV